MTSITLIVAVDEKHRGSLLWAPEETEDNAGFLEWAKDSFHYDTEFPDYEPGVYWATVKLFPHQCGGVCILEGCDNEPQEHWEPLVAIWELPKTPTPPC